jgi:hypothetical protein
VCTFVGVFNRPAKKKMRANRKMCNATKEHTETSTKGSFLLSFFISFLCALQEDGEWEGGGGSCPKVVLDSRSTVTKSQNPNTKKKEPSYVHVYVHPCIRDLSLHILNARFLFFREQREGQ